MLHYANSQYDSKGRFISYWHQIHEILELRPSKVLEIGIGNGFVSRYLAWLGVDVVTCDIEPELRPDVVASVLELPFGEEEMDVTSCCEVLEHLPYEHFVPALREIARTCGSAALVSLPDSSRAWKICLTVPGMGEQRLLVGLPRFGVKPCPPGDEHSWEIGRPGYPLARIVADMRSAGFDVHNTYRVFENPYHRFFILRKTKKPAF